MRKLKIAALATICFAPIGAIQAGSANSPSPVTPQPVAMPEAGFVVDGNQGQSWDCTWVYFVGRWICIPS